MAYSQSSHTNNPFAAGSVPGALEATANRFPAVDSPSPSQYQQPQYAPQQQAPQQQQQYLQPQYTAQPPQAQSQFTGYPGGGSSSGFQPQSYGGQQIQSQVTGIQQAQQYGGGSPYQQGSMNGAGAYGGGVSAQGFGGGGYPQQGGFGGQPQPQQQQAFVSDFDPYGNLGTLANAGGGGGQVQQASGASSAAPQQQPEAHPRSFVQTHKAQLTQWDDYSWKQLLNRVDGLREAWEARKNAVAEVQGKGGDPYTVEQLRKEAENNIDSIHASKLQISEVQAGWRHSTDLASKARVREALNSGLNSLPEFPKALVPEQLGGIFAQRATEDHRKQSILQHFNTPQQQGLVPLYAQPTGYPGAGMMQQQQTGYPQQSGFHSQQQFLGPQQPWGGYQPQGPQYYG